MHFEARWVTTIIIVKCVDLTHSYGTASQSAHAIIHVLFPHTDIVRPIVIDEAAPAVHLSVLELTIIN